MAIDRNERHRNILDKMGFSLLSDYDFLDIGIIEASYTTDNGNIEISWGTNGTVKVYKPNGKVKWLYEKTDAQVCNVLRQTIKANAYRRY